MLNFVIRATASLLGVAACILVLGSFDAALGWDIFGPTVEAALYAILFSSLGLAAIGLALCFVFGIHELVDLMRRTQSGEPLPPTKPMAFYRKRAAIVVAIVAALVVGLELADDRIQTHRRSVFRGIAQEQLHELEPKLIRALPPVPPASTPELDALMRTLENLDFVSGAQLYLADASDASALWRYERNWDGGASRFERIFAAKRLEKAAARALRGEPADLLAENQSDSFVWVAPVSGRAVLVIRGNENENFRLYAGGS